MFGMKKIGMTLALAAGIGGAVLAAPAANASPVHGGSDVAQSSGCYFNYQWYDICPTNRIDRDDRDRRDRRRDRDHHEDHGNNH
ncbi:hypothetical protein JGU72_10680 [Antrihabitans sp. YC2-6]|nr:hypothetical protein [Antrihabitans sp. YC2-6]